MNQYLDILSIFLIAIFLFLSLKNQEKGIIFGILIKPVVDTSWDINFSGVSIIELYSVLFLVISFKLLLKKGSITYTRGLTLLWFLAHLGVVFQLVLEPINGLTSLLKMFYFPISVFILPYFLIYSNTNYQKLLLRALLLGALFSSAISILQYIGIIPYEYDHMSKGLQRANGFYHDMVTSRMYVLQGLITLAYIKFSPRLTIKTWLSWTLLLLFLFSSFTLFSKALIGILVLGALFLLIFTKQKISNYVVGGLLFFVLILSNLATIVETTTTLFSSELEYNTGELDESSRLFSGRGGLWKGYLNQFESSTFLEKSIGFGINSGRTHNEFLRILILSGVIGLVAYSLFIIRLISKALKSAFKSQLSFIVVFSLAIMLIDSISVVWGLYPFYLIVIVGFYISSIHEIKNNENQHFKSISIW